MYYTPTAQFQRLALAAGVKDKTLAPLKTIQSTTDAIREALDDLYGREQSNLQTAISNGTTNTADLIQAAKADAELSAQARELENFTNYSAVENSLLEKLDIPALIDGCINDLQTPYATATEGLQKISSRWGSTNPDPATVADQATPEELQQFRDRTTHTQSLNAIKTFLRFLAEDSAADRNPFNVIKISTLAARYPQFSITRMPQENWFLDNTTGKLLGFHQTRAKLNAAAADAEQSWRQAWWKGNTFVPDYTIDPKHQDKATFNADGTPTNPAWLLTDTDDNDKDK